MTQFKRCKPTEMVRDEFVSCFADIYEHSPWVAESVFDSGLTQMMIILKACI
ncbi:hypothetical protein JCM19235_2410 [Vibrio maritimus]|uniref:Uncharacterized protein n=1 Tax=Vibrio maritimus TaxID=990268 RepID=A0A090SHU2_9VIBR|nr:hypothetical protein JCM19235_2410 [Vibrio maritimus]